VTLIILHTVPFKPRNSEIIRRANII
jgi:hypothetical protein